MDILFTYLTLGALAGLLSGLFGIGGGLILVPLLAWSFTQQGMNTEILMIMAIATSLSTIIVTALSSIRAHHKRSAIDWTWVTSFAPGLLVGSIIGTTIAENLPANTLRLIFAVFLFCVTAQMFFSKSQNNQQIQISLLIRSSVATVIGALSAILGIGGGTLTVPFLSQCGLQMKNAVAISAACGLPIAVFSSASYVLLGWNNPLLPEATLGYIYLPAFFGIICSSLLFAPVGVMLAHRLPTEQLKRYFSLLVFIMGIKLLFS